MWENKQQSKSFPWSFNNSKCLIFYFIYCNQISLKCLFFAIPVLCMHKKSSETSRVLSLSIIFPRLSAVQSQRLWHWLYLLLPSRECELLPANLSMCAFVHMQTTKLHSITSLFYAREESVTDLVNRAAGVCEKGSMGINLNINILPHTEKNMLWLNPNYECKKKTFWHKKLKSWPKHYDKNVE